MKNLLSKSHFALALTCLAVICALALLGTALPSVAQAESVAAQSFNEMSFKETATDSLKYDALERTNYVNVASREPTAEKERFQGMFGKTAVGRTAQSDKKSYQLFFDNCFEEKNTYEISFWAKSVGAQSDFYVKVWYAGNDNLSKKEDLPTLKGVEGAWTKYSFTFTSDKNLKTCFKLTLEIKGTFQEVYFDQFCAVLLSEDYSPLICGQQFNVADWNTSLTATDVVPFSNGNYPAAVKTVGELDTKVFKVPQSGYFRLRFAVQRTAGAVVSIAVKDAIGNTIKQVTLTTDPSVLLAYYDVATPDLSAHSFVYLQFSTQCSTTDDYALVGMVEMVEHTHDITNQPVGYPQDFLDKCTRVNRCKTCQLDLVEVYHNFEITQEPTCGRDGSKVCTNTLCNLTVVLPATGEHSNYVDIFEKTPVDITCSPSVYNAMVECGVCGNANSLKYGMAEHQFVVQSISATEHQAVCVHCNYSQGPQLHTASHVEIPLNPSDTEMGFAVLSCNDCNQKHSYDLPSITDANADAWTYSKVTEEDCLQQGKETFTLNAQPAIVVERSVEALGHDYEAIKQMPNCIEGGISLHHKCRICGATKEDESSIKELTALGHELSGWEIVKQPTLEEDGLRKMHCTRCQQLVEEQQIPKLDETNYTKYALDDHNEAEGFYYYYSSDDWGTYSVFVEGKNSDLVVILAICISCAVVIGGSVAAYCIVANKTKRKKVK